MINRMWNCYKEKKGLRSDIVIDELRFDAAEGTEASFDLIELLKGQTTLHVTKRLHLYRGDFVQFLLWHEFTHLYDFITYPYEKPDPDDAASRGSMTENVNTASDRAIFGNYGEIRLPRKQSAEDLLKSDAGKRLFDYMNTYSEFHACRTALGMIFHDAGSLRGIDADKNQIPAPFREISLKRMLGDCLRRAHVAYKKFEMMMVPQVFVVYFRQIMYLYGYVSFFGNDTEALRQSFEVLGIADKEELYLAMYQALKEKRIDDILLYSERIYRDSYLLFVREYIRKHYDPGLYTEEELAELTPDNYHDFLEMIANRKGGRLWSGRVSPVYGVHDVGKAYGPVDAETIKEIIEKNRKLPGGQMKPDF